MPVSLTASDALSGVAERYYILDEDPVATYTDPEGHLWVSTMRHAGIVYPDPSPVVARCVFSLWRGSSYL